MRRWSRQESQVSKAVGAGGREGGVHGAGLQGCDAAGCGNVVNVRADDVVHAHVVAIGASQPASGTLYSYVSVANLLRQRL